MGLVSVVRTDLSVGMPLPWAVHDQDGNVLMPEGQVLESVAQIETLLAANPLRELSWTAPSNVVLTAEDETPQLDAATDAALATDSGDGGFTFQDMRLRVGDRIQLQPPAAVSAERHVVKLIGYLEKATVLTTAPMANGLRVPLRENDTVVARIFAGQKAFGFSATIERVCKIPYDYLHLSFPEKVQGSVIRKSPRVRTKIIASVTNLNGGNGAAEQRQSGIIVNLSADGALLRARQPLGDKGNRLQLAFRVSLHKVDAYLTIGAIIRSTFGDDENGEASMFNHGLQFQELAANDTVILQSLIYQQMIEQPHTVT